MYRRPPPPPGAMGLMPPPGSLPPVPIPPRGLPPGPPHPADMAGESLRSAKLLVIPSLCSHLSLTLLE